MATHDVELLGAARLLLRRKAGQRGRLPGALVRRSISTTYYALFHFILDEVGRHVVGSGNGLRVRRRILARSIAHKDIKLACERIRGAAIDPKFQQYFGLASAPRFAQELARTFPDAQSKRHDADYDLNKALSEADARLLEARVRRVVRRWRKATSASDRDFKHAVCALILLKGSLRSEN